MMDFDLEEAFDQFWKEYPKTSRLRRTLCVTLFFQNISDCQEESGDAKALVFERIMAGLNEWKVSRAWENGYIHQAHTFLADRLWKEHPVSAKDHAATYSRRDRKSIAANDWENPPQINSDEEIAEFLAKRGMS